MTTPDSLKVTPFKSFGGLSWKTILTDDFCHKKLANFKLKAATPKNATIQIKAGVNMTETFNDKDEREKLSFAVGDETKFGFPVGDRYYLDTRIRRKGELKLHLDAGNAAIAGKNYNLFANLKTNLGFACPLWNFGINYFGSHCQSGTRIQKACCKPNTTVLAQKTIIKEGDWKFAFLAMMNLHTLKAKKYDVLLGYTHKDFDLFVQHITPKNIDPEKDGDYPLGKLSAALVYRMNDKYTIAAQYYNRRNKKAKSRVVLGLQGKIDDKNLFKTKVDQKGKIVAVWKYKLNNLCTMCVGSALKLQKGAKAVDTKKLIPIPLGFNFDLSI